MRTLLCCGICLFASGIYGQDYEVVDRAGRVKASATILRGQLVVVESTGQRVSFRRETRYDSPDGQMLGFLNVDLQRVLRFPRSGWGVMQVTDLDDPNPRFRETLRKVRPAEVDPLIGYIPAYGAGHGLAGDPYAYSYPYVWGYRPRPRSLLIESKTVAKSPLKPAKLALTNGGPRDVLVTVVDLNTGQPSEHRIHPGQQVEIEAQRDQGGKRIARYQTVSPAGGSVVKEVVTKVPPKVRYEIVVHEWVMQSVAIDRTGKSPAVIEDVNYQGKGLGRFTLPPGDQLRSGTLDVYRAAIAANNRQSVVPITAQEKPIGDGSSPLERAVRDLRR